MGTLMILVIGGCHQGKLSYVLSQSGYGEADVGASPAEKKPIVNNLHHWLRETENPMPMLEDYLTQVPHAVILCDEIGCGVVPLEKKERIWRERVGRTCCVLAQRADAVVRITCGIPTILKGELLWKSF